MEISVSELNELLQKEFDRGRQCPIPKINSPYVQIEDWKPQFYTISSNGKDNIPEACKNCSNHPSNGGSGLCHCTLGREPIMYTTTTVSNCYNTKDE